MTRKGCALPTQSACTVLTIRRLDSLTKLSTQNNMDEGMSLPIAVQDGNPFESFKLYNWKMEDQQKELF